MDVERLAQENGWSEWEKYVLFSLEELKARQEELAKLLRNELYGEGRDCPGLKQKVATLWEFREGILRWRWLIISAILSGVVSLVISLAREMIR